MNGQSGYRRLHIIGGILIIIVLLWMPLIIFHFQSVRSADVLTVTFLNVGQGDAIFIETPEGMQILIDGGPDAAILRELGRVMSVWDRSIDVVIGTHPDKDHVGGLVDVLDRYHVRQVVRTDNRNDTAASRAFDTRAETEGAAIAYAEVGQVWSFGASTTMTIFSPLGDEREWESNSASIVAQLRYGDIEFMFTGDIGMGIENYLVDKYEDSLRSEVLKLGHHGSRTSSGEAFLVEVDPTYSIVSSGVDNTYGHPHDEVVERVKESGSQLLNTALTGRITFTTDGKTLRLSE